METGNWPGYNELAWIEPIIAPPEDYTASTEQKCRLIRQHSRIEPQTLLHLGSGAGMNDYTFKKHFRVTGVDISDGMLEMARQLNPEAVYYRGDMRTVALGKQFDVVVCMEAIGYMLTVEDTRRALSKAYEHLKPGGVFLFTTLLKDDFRENNFAYSGARGDVEVTVFENNYLPDPEGTTYEATLVYLIRRRGELEIHTERHFLSLFKLETWAGLLRECNFAFTGSKETESYNSYLLGEGSYPVQVFTCVKPGAD